MSSALPWSIVPDDGVEDGEELSCDGDEGDHFRFAGSDEASVEGLELRITPGGGHGSHEESCPHGAAAATDEALAAPLARLPGPGSETTQGGDLTAIEGTEFGQFGDDRPGDRLSYTGDGGEEVFLLPPDRRTANGFVDILIDAGQLLLAGKTDLQG